jgi:hypothetical protein
MLDQVDAFPTIPSSGIPCWRLVIVAWCLAGLLNPGEHFGAMRLRNISGAPRRFYPSRIPVRQGFSAVLLDSVFEWAPRYDCRGIWLRNRSPLQNAPTGQNAFVVQTLMRACWVTTGLNGEDGRSLFCRFLVATPTHRYALTSNLFPAGAGPDRDCGRESRNRSGSNPAACQRRPASYQRRASTILLRSAGHMAASPPAFSAPRRLGQQSNVRAYVQAVN